MSIPVLYMRPSSGEALSIQGFVGADAYSDICHAGEGL